MRFSFNLPGRVTKIKITLTEEHDNDIMQEKSYTFKRDQFKVFENDHQRSAFINSLIGPEWVNSDDIRMKKKEQRAKRKEAYAARKSNFGNKIEEAVENYNAKMDHLDSEKAEFAEYMNVPTGEEGGNE